MSKSSHTAVLAALFGNTMIAVTKFFAAIITNSTSMFAEALHSLADTGNQVFLLVGVIRSKLPPTTDHPFGYGKEHFFWAFLVAVFMFFVGSLVSIYKGINGLLNPHHLENPVVNYLVLGFAAFFEGITLLIAFREFNKKRRSTLLKDLRDAKDLSTVTVIVEDSAALTGIALAAAGTFLSTHFKTPVFDSTASILIGLVLAGVAYFLADKNKALLIGESASHYHREKIREAVQQVPEVTELIDLLTMHIGPDEILVNLNVHFEDGLDTDQLELVIDEIEKRIHQAVPEVGRIFIEADTLKRTRKK